MERHPLLPECFITFYGCMKMIRGAPGSIYKPLIVKTMSFIPNKQLQNSCKISYFRYPLCMGNMRMYVKERHPLLLKCLTTILRYIKMVRRAPDRIYNPHVVHKVSFLT